ncbi:hypothetical protein AQUCO_02600044v1 [Aquilegia coerulea]|uniref:PsbP C-terminal domain-containing protein n=1 Tax=Aquilegia coerulea TaxID=218851 RepID=A0A2G5D735_AQUCA|nr:hypothetical protein AQUCO_02600044v1 [Aquilegia coerulea]
MAFLLSMSSHPTKLLQNPNPNPKPKSNLIQTSFLCNLSKRDLASKSAAISILVLRLFPNEISFAETPPSKSFLSGIVNTKSWFQFFGDGFSIRVPPQFVDIMEPEDYNAGLSLYGDKAKAKTFAARFATPDGSEVLSVVNRPSTSLKITFLEANDITELGSLKGASKFFVPGGATIYSARSIKIKEAEGLRTYYFYEFGIEEQHVAIVAGVSRGKAYIAGATAPHSKWEEDGARLRSAAISLTLL